MTLRAAAVLLLAVGLPAQQPVSWPSMGVGVVEFTTRTDVEQLFVVGKNRNESHVELNTRERWEVLSVQPNGTVTLEVRRTRVWGRVDRRGVVVEFDTAQEDGVPRVAEIWVEAMPARQVFEIRESGEVVSVRTADEDDELGEPDDHDRQTLQATFVKMPAEPVAVGGSWKPEVGIHECTSMGCVAYPTTNTLRAADAQTLTIATRAVPPKPEGEKVKDHEVITRTVVLSRTDGLPRSLELAGKQVNGRMGTRTEISMRMTMTRVEAGATSRPSEGKSGKKG